MPIHDHYIARRPVFPQSVLEQLYKLDDASELIRKMVQEDAFLERILVASPDLFAELQRVRSQEQEWSKDILTKVIKYLLRMSSRAMPFGLFSGITRKRFSQEGRGQSESYKKVRASVDWLYRLSKEMEREQDSFSKLLLYKNSMLRMTQDYIYLDTVQGEEVKRAEFKKSVFITELLNYLAVPRTIKECVHYFARDHSDLRETILRSLKTLLQHDFLYSSFRPGSIYHEEDGDGLDQLIQEAEHSQQQDYAERLREIKQHIQEYEQLQIGAGIEKYQLLKGKMSELCSASRTLVVDLFLENEAPPLELKQIKGFLEDIHFLSFFHTYSTNRKTWEEYSHQFLIEYGLFHEVPLLDVLDTDTGIGLPVVKNIESKGEAKWNALILNLFQEALLRHQRKIKLTSDHIEMLMDIFGKREETKIKDGFDVKFNVVEENGEVKILLTDNSFAPTAGSFTGRFFNSELVGEIPKFANEQYVSAEINAVPLHYGDIGVTYYPAEHQINFNTGHTSVRTDLSLEDLYLGMDYNGLYLKSKTLNKKILPVTTHLLHYINFNENPVLIFISQLGRFLSSSPKNFSFSWQNVLKFVPRIEYKNIILSPMRWNMDRSEMLREVRAKRMSERQFVQDFLTRYSVEPAVHILKGDQTLPVLTGTKLGVELILAELQRLGSGGVLTLMEAVEVHGQPGQRYITDYIVSVFPEEQNSSLSATGKRSRDSKPRQELKVGSAAANHDYDLSWTYFNIYYRKGKRLTTCYSCLEHVQKLGIESYFVMNYLDPDEHIRLRFKSEDAWHKEAFREFLRQLVQDKVIKRYSESLFQPEYERYGGVQLSQEAYDLFCLESKWFYQLLQINFFKGKSKQELGILLCIHTIMDMFDSYEGGKQFLDQLAQEQGRQCVKFFKKQREHYVSLGQKAIRLYDASNELLYRKRYAQRSYVQKVLNSFAPEKAHYILKSMLHMTMNRFIGTKLKLEGEVYEFSCYTYYSLKYQMEILGGYHEFV